MSDKFYSDTEEFILKEFFAGKGIDALIRDYLSSHDVSKKKAEEVIYSCINDYALSY